MGGHRRVTRPAGTCVRRVVVESGALLGARAKKPYVEVFFEDVRAAGPLTTNHATTKTQATLGEGAECCSPKLAPTEKNTHYILYPMS